MNHLQEISSRELRENIDVKCDTIAGVLNLMLEEGVLIRRRKGTQKVCGALPKTEIGSEIKAQKSLPKPLPVL